MKKLCNTCKDKYKLAIYLSVYNALERIQLFNFDNLSCLYAYITTCLQMENWDNPTYTERDVMLRTVQLIHFYAPGVSIGVKYDYYEDFGDCPCNIKVNYQGRGIEKRGMVFNCQVSKESLRRIPYTIIGMLAAIRCEVVNKSVIDKVVQMYI